MTMDGRTSWLALLVLCLGDLMIVLDTTIVNVALPSIRAGPRLLRDFARLGGERIPAHVRRLPAARRPARRPVRPPPAVPHRHHPFTAASLACGVATTQEFLIAARAVQGVGGAIVSAVALSLIMVLFTEPAERAKAMGVFGFVAAGGGSIGVLLGGVLTDAARLALDLPRQPADRCRRRSRSRCVLLPADARASAAGSTSPARSR